MRPLRSRLPAALLAAALAVALAFAVTACGPAAASAPQTTPPETAHPPAPPAGSKATWKEVDRLLGEQKLAEAAKQVEQLEAAARERGDDRDLARALVRQTQIGLALGGYETAVEALAAKAWPAAPRPRAEVELYYAHAIAGYLDAYRWEIQGRER